MILTPLEVEHAAIKMAWGCVGRKWEDIKDEAERENFRRAVKNLAVVYDVKKSDKAMAMFMKWVGFEVPKTKDLGYG